MTSNIQFVSEFAGSIPNASAAGKVRLFRDVADGLLKFKDHTGAIFAIAGAQDYKDAVRVASAAPLPAYTRVGNTITADANGALAAIDGVTLTLNDSFLYVSGTGTEERDNGIWTVTQVGNGSLPFILDRRGDMAASSQVSAGMVVPTGPEGGSNASKLFILVTPDPIVLNSSALTFDAISGGGGFSHTEIDSTVSVPEQQSMLYSDDVVIEDDGDLNLDGDATPVREEENFSVNFIPQRSVRVVQENDQMLFTDSMQIDGDLIVDGDILDATPYDGNDILAALTAVAPNTPSILGVASPASFLSPAQARTVMDVPSVAEMDAAIAAGVGGLTFESGVKTSEFTATPGKIYVWDADLEIDATLPDAPEDDAMVAFVADSTNGVSGELEVESNTNPLFAPSGPLEIEIPGTSYYAYIGLQFRRTGGPGEGFWALVSGDLVMLAMLSIGENALPITNTSGAFTPIQVVDESVVGRTGGGAITSIPISSLSNPGAVPFTTTLYNSNSTSESNKINRLDGTATFSMTFPTDPADGTVVGFTITGNGGTVTLAAGGSNVISFGPTQVPGLPIVMKANLAGFAFFYRFDAQTSPGLWRVDTDAFTFGLSFYANQLATSDASGNPQGVVIDDNTFVGRYNGSDIGSVEPSDARSLMFPDQTFVNAVVNTTDATPTQIYVYGTGTDNAVITFDLLIRAQSNANTDVAVFKMVGVCHRANGAATVTEKDITFVNGPYRDAGAAAWTVTFNIAGGGPNIAIEVTGDAGESIDWRVTGTIDEFQG